MMILQLADELLLTDFEVLQKISMKLFFRLLIDFLSILLLVKVLYFKIYKRNDLFFTFYIFNLVIFLISFLLNKVEISMGAAFGLFAVFSMLRYKTEEISIKDMTYLFLVIAIGLINAIAKIKGASDFYEYSLLIIINGIILLVAYLLESKSISNQETSQIINYDRLDLIKPEHELELINDIKNRTGIKVDRVVVGKIDLTKNAVQLKIFYKN